MRRKRFVGVKSIDTCRVGDRTYAFGIYRDAIVGEIAFAGMAEKDDHDRDKPNCGRNLAIGRAFENLGKEIQKREWKKIQGPKKRNTPAPVWTVEQIEEERSKPEAQEKIAYRRIKKNARTVEGKK